ncbi:MAG: hypothetical protein ABIO41_10465, partial [Ignavibacteria bacterium]
MKTFNFIIIFLSISIILNAQNEPSEINKPAGKVWGYAFGDYFIKLGGEAGEGYAGEYSNFKSSFNAFDFRRIYIGYDHEISKSFDARFVLS